MTAAMRTVGEPFGFINIMNGAPAGFSRWDNASNAEAAIGTLDTALTKAGLPDQLQTPLALLDRIADLTATARVKRDEARQRLELANRALAADGPIDLDSYAATLSEIAPWIDEQSPASIGVGDAARAVRVRAVMVVFALAGDLYRKLRDHAVDVVAAIAAIPDPPAEVWQCQTIGDASMAMIRADRAEDWGRFAKLGGEAWTSIQTASKLIIETGQLEGEMHFPDGAPTDVARSFLNWVPAIAGQEELKRIAGPLRIRRAADAGWRPGVWTASDHAAAVEVNPRPQMPVASVALASEFA